MQVFIFTAFLIIIISMIFGLCLGTC
jgi:hypothetical protein